MIRAHDRGDQSAVNSPGDRQEKFGRPIVRPHTNSAAIRRGPLAALRLQSREARVVIPPSARVEEELWTPEAGRLLPAGQLAVSRR